MGQAIRDYFHTGRAQRLRVLSSMFDEDEMPVPHLFRTEAEMNALERTALQLARGRVLDVGAGSGCHSLALQSRGLEVRAIDVSPFSVETMRERGVADVQLADFFDDDFGSAFDTILMLMNGIGICGSLDTLPQFFARLDALLAPGGCALIDSCDLRFVLGDDDGQIDPNDFDDYFGEVDYQMQYGRTQGHAFNWLYVDFETLASAAASCGFSATMLREGDEHDFLARLERVG
ncbi:MAG: methyltransferase domain-containing protein [Bacteroidaceae bacterium]|nr:methyltransferase domain-containing protein [Bacteroidaceae bacterium]